MKILGLKIYKIMNLNPNQYKHLVKAIKSARKNNPHRALLEVLSEVAIVNHTPLVAALLLCQRYVENSEEIRHTIAELIKFYKYDHIEEIQHDVPEVQQEHPGAGQPDDNKGGDD